MDLGNLPIATVNVDEAIPVEEGSGSENPVSEEHEELEIGRNILAKFYSRRGKKIYKYVCRITSLDP